MLNYKILVHTHTYVTVLRKTNRSARKLINTFEHEHANGHKEKEAHFTCTWSIGLASNWTAASLLDVQGNKAIKIEICFSH